VSLINQMLQDLEQRRSAAGHQAAVFQGLSGSATPGTRRGRVTLVMGGAILGLTVALALSLYGRGQPVSAMHVAAPAPQPAAIPAQAPDAAPASVVPEPSIPQVVASAPVHVAAETADVEPAPVSSEPAAPTAPRESEKESGTPPPPRSSDVTVAVAPIQKAAPAAVVKKRARPLTRAELAELDYGKAVSELQAGHQALGESTLRAALAHDPGHIKARELLVGLLIRGGRIDEAGGLLRQGLEFYPGHTPFAKLYARILVEQGNVAGAVKVLDGALPDVAMEPDYHAFRAALYQRLKQHSRAVAIYRQVVKARPDAGVWWMGLAISLEAQGEASDALQAFRRAAVSGGLNADLQKYVQGRMVALNANR